MAPGRHRAFDEGEAIEAAMLVFWRNGYAGTSLADLTQAMAINKPSLYAAFGPKEQLFMTALNEYVIQHSFLPFEHLQAPDQPLDQRLYVYLKTVANKLSHPKLPGGCMLANSTCEAAGDSMPKAAHNLIADLNEKAIQYLTDFFAQEQANGYIKSQSSPPTLALYLLSINGGMAILARNGASFTELDDMVKHVVRTMI